MAGTLLKGHTGLRSSDLTTMQTQTLVAPAPNRVPRPAVQTRLEVVRPPGFDPSGDAPRHVGMDWLLLDRRPPAPGGSA